MKGAAAFRPRDKLESGGHECGGFAERRLRKAGSGAGAKAAALRTGGGVNQCLKRVDSSRLNGIVCDNNF
jgi:hypothetical protein